MRAIHMAAVAVAALTASSAASAQTFDFYNDYGSTVFSYGYGTVGGTFTSFTNSYPGGCFGVAALACMTPGSDSIQPVVAKNTSGSAVTFSTVTVPTGLLLLHPGPNATGSDAIVKFIAPVSGSYNVGFSFSRLDNTSNGNGVLLSFGINNVVTGSAPLLPTTGTSLSFFGPGVRLNKGDTLSFAVGNAGEYSYDSTGLSGMIDRVGGVPEPATWALMIIGFGAAGGMMRRRIRNSEVRFTEKVRRIAEGELA